MRIIGLGIFLPLLIWSQDVASHKVLVFSKTKDYRHESTEAGINALRKLGAKNGIEVEATENASCFTLKKLRKYDAIIFLNSSGDVFNRKQEKAFEDYIRSGGGFVGIHGATTTEYEWEWFGNFVGGYFNGHPEPQDATLIVTDTTHLSTHRLPGSWTHFDEWYNFRWVNPKFNVLLSVDEETYEGGNHPDNHPISWYKEDEGGRMFYTALGHTTESYSNDYVLDHILGGILYVLNKPGKE